LEFNVLFQHKYGYIRDDHNVSMTLGVGDANVSVTGGRG